jgi:uncharacterized damage-inducible protein DinB
MSDIHEELGRAVLQSAEEMFRAQKRLADSAIRQISFEQMKIEPDPESNSVNVLMKHLANAMRSRWTDFLTTDGEKPWRDRDEEFTDRYQSREEVEHDWEAGWDILFKSLSQLGPIDLTASVTIRDEPETVIGTIHRQMAHYGYHIGQIIVLCRTQAGDNWSTLTVPRSKSHK